MSELPQAECPHCNECTHIEAAHARIEELEHQLREATGHLAELLHCVPPALSFEKFGHLWGMAYWHRLEDRIRTLIAKVRR